MRFYEFLAEAELSPKEMLKHYGKYSAALIKMIAAGKEIAVDPTRVKAVGAEKIYIKPTEAERFKQVVFGKADPDDPESLNVKGDNIEPADPNGFQNFRFEVDTEKSGVKIDRVLMSYLHKSTDIKGGKGFNTGDVAEGFLGAAVAAKFIKRNDGDVNAQDVMKVISEMRVDEMGKNKLGTYTTQVAEDSLVFKVSLNKISFEAMHDAARSGKFHPDMKGLLNSSIAYANKDEGVVAANQRIIEDRGTNKVLVESDGVGDQTGTKADLFLTIDNEKVNLISLKAGSVKQFGQASGFSYKNVDGFFESTFGVNVNDKYIEKMQDGTPQENFEIIKTIYKDMAGQIKKELAGNTDNEFTFLQRLYKGIRYHATRNDDNVQLVILSTSVKSSGYDKLQFNKELEQALQQYDLDVPLQESPPVLRIFGNPVGQAAQQLGGDNMLLQLRSNLKSEGRGFVRNIVEMGSLLKKLAKVQQSL